MNRSDFSFELPPELIAQTPIKRRERSRLLCLDRRLGVTSHRRFFELPELLRSGDCIVLNDSRVLPARLLGRRETGGAAEIVLLREAGDMPLRDADGASRQDAEGVPLRDADGASLQDAEGVLRDADGASLQDAEACLRKQ